MATKPSFEAVIAFLSGIWDKWSGKILAAKAEADAALAAFKKYADSLAPGVFDDEYNRLNAAAQRAQENLTATIEQAKQSIDPRQVVVLMAQEFLELAKTGQSKVKQPRTNLAG